MAEAPKTRPVDRNPSMQVYHPEEYVHDTYVVEDHGVGQRLLVSRVAQLIWLGFGILDALIGLRFVLKLIGANPENPFANLLYNFTDLFLWPFWGLTGSPSVESIVLEIPAIIAILVYTLIGWSVVRVIWLIFYRPATRRVRTVEHLHDQIPD